MGRPKLLLPIGGTAVIARVVAGLAETAGPTRRLPSSAEVKSRRHATWLAMRAGGGKRVVLRPPPPTCGPRSRPASRPGPTPRPHPDGPLLCPGRQPGDDAGLVGAVIARSRADPPGSSSRRRPTRASVRPAAGPWRPEIRELPPGSGSMRSARARRPVGPCSMPVDEAAAVRRSRYAARTIGGGLRGRCSVVDLRTPSTRESLTPFPILSDFSAGPFRPAGGRVRLDAVSRVLVPLRPWIARDSAMSPSSRRCGPCCCVSGRVIAARRSRAEDEETRRQTAARSSR